MPKLQHHARLKPPALGWELATVDIGPSGNANCLWQWHGADPINGRPTSTFGQPYFPPSRLPHKVKLVATEQIGPDIVKRALLTGVDVAIPKIQIMPDGIWLIGTRAYYHDDGPELNGTFWSNDGQLARSGCFGDGISKVRARPDGDLWIGYFDEGVFGNYGWGVPDGPTPLGAHGVVLWDGGTFTKKWEPEGYGDLCDVYAATLVGDDLWTSTYVDFPISRFDGKTQIEFPTSDSGTRALIVGGDIAATFGEYRHPWSYRIWQLEEATTRTRFIKRGELSRPTGLNDKTPTIFAGYGEELNVYNDGNWYKMALSSLLG